MRILGIDFGFKRIGLAIAESGYGVITPKPTIEASGTLKTDAANLDRIARKEEAERLVIGLPVEEDGNLGKMARVCQTVAENLRTMGWQVDLVDERYSSREAEQTLLQEDLKASQRRKLRDGEAAGIILARYLESLEEA